MAGVFAGEHEGEIAQAHLLEPARGAHDHMVTHAAQDAAHDHDHAGVGPGPPGRAGGRDPIGGDRGGLEARHVDMGGHDDEAFRRHPVALGNHVGDLVAQRDHLLAAGHHAVVGMLEPVLVAEFGVPGGDEGHPGHTGGGKGAPARRTGKRMHDAATALADEPRQGDGIMGDNRRVTALHVELHELGAARSDLAFEPSAGRDHQGPMPGHGKGAGKLDGILIGRAALERRDRDHDC